MTLCLAQWKWFVVSIIICVGLGYLYVIRQIPQYSRTMQVLIQDTDQDGSMDINNAFKSFGLGGSNTNVNNELASLKSPAVMQEVVKRLNLTINIAEKELPHNIPLYGKKCPATITAEENSEFGSVSFIMDLQPDDSYVLRKFKAVNKGGDKLKSDKVIKGKLGFNPVHTPYGTFVFAPNGSYTNDREEEETLKISKSSEHSTIEYYSSLLKAELTDEDSEVIDLTITDASTTKATDILNTIVEVYNEFWLRDKNRTAIATSEFITERLTMLVKELSEVDDDIAKYKSANQITDVDKTASMMLEEASTVSNSVLTLRNQLAMAKYTRDYINNPANSEKVVPMLLEGSNMESAIKDYNNLLISRQTLLENAGRENPLLDNYNTQLKTMREAINRTTSNYVASLEAQMRSLEAAQGTVEGQLSKAPEQAKYLNTIMRDQEIKAQLYLYLLQKKEENDLSQAFNGSNTRIITPPFGSNTPVSPKKTSTLAVAFLLGIIIPGGIIYFIKMSDTKVRTRKDLESLPIPFAGEIPMIGSENRLRRMFMSRKAIQEEIDKPKPIVAEGKRDVPNEAFRVVRSNIDLMLNKEGHHPIVMVTSFNPRSGKSFVAFNIGASFSLRNRKVLLIDGDLRHGSLSTYVGSPSRGLSTYLTGKTSDLSKIIYPVKDLPNLSVMPIGKRPPNPAELLEGAQFGELLELLREEYDMILIDCPPVNIVVDTQIINNYADATLFVVRAGLFERSMLNDLKNLYTDKKLKRMSLLLNATDTEHSSYYTYGGYHSYHSDED